MSKPVDAAADVAASQSPEPSDTAVLAAPGPAALIAGREGCKSIAPEELILDASCAFDALARRAVMHNRSGLSKVQADIVMSLAFLGPMSMTQLAGNLAVSKEHVSRAVAVLCERGLVSKHRSEQSFRLVIAQLTQEGVEFSNKIRVASLESLTGPLASLSADEQAELVALSKRAIELLGKIDLD